MVPWQTVSPGPKSPSKLRTIGPPVLPPLVLELLPVVPDPLPEVEELPPVVPELPPVVLEAPPALVLFDPPLVLPEEPFVLLPEPPVEPELPAELLHPTGPSPTKSTPRKPTRLMAVGLISNTRPRQRQNGNPSPLSR